MELSIALTGHSVCTLESCVSTSNTKCKTVATFGSTPTFCIEDYSLYEVENVQQVGVQPRENYGWDVAYIPEVEGPLEDVYLCVDTIYNETWPHWVAESAIYFVVWSKLKKIYPSLKLYSLRKKIFKEAMYAAFHIPLDDIVFSIPSARNKFIFPHYISLADHRTPFLFMKHMSNFYKYFAVHCPTKEKTIDILYLPRGSKENSKGTERSIPVQTALIDFLSNVPNATILYTDDTNNMLDQWDIVRRAKVLIVNEGGNHGINGFMAEQSQILVLGGDGNGCHFQNPSPALVYYDSVKRGNKYYHISYGAPLHIVLEFLSAIVSDRANPVPTPHVSCWRNCLFCKYQEYEKY